MLNFLLSKTHENVTPESCYFGTCSKTFVSFASDPTGGVYSSPPDPLAVFRDLLLRKGRKGREERD